MTGSVHVAAACVNQTPLDWDGNRTNILAAVEQARAADARVLCLPELCITGYGCEDAFHSPSVQQTAWRVLEEIVPETRGMIVCLGLPVMHRNALFNCGCVVVDGRVAGLVGKRFLSGDGLHYEPRWFKPWPQEVRETLARGGDEYPIGDLVFDCGQLKIGLEICEDAWVAARPGGGMSPHGIDVVLNPSASHFAFGKHEIRRRLVLEGSRAMNVSYVYANLMGNEAGRIVYDGGALIAWAGQMVAVGPRFSFQPMQLTHAVVDVATTRMRSAQRASFQPRLGDDHPGEVRCAFDWRPSGGEAAATTKASADASLPAQSVPPETPDLACPLAAPEVARKPTSAAWESAERIKEEEFARAVALGLFDYLRKTRSQGFVVSLSGGADSSACASLVALMVQFAVDELGASHFVERLGHVAGLGEGRDNRQRVRRLLHCVYQSSVNSSQTTRDAAATVAEGIGAEFSEFAIDQFVEGYVGAIERVLGRQLTWEGDDLALQNIQARVRGPGVWLLANVKKMLLLTTSNRSEAAVGYATMDGDTCGGLAPIAGIDKAFLRSWLCWLEKVGPVDARPMPALAAVNRLQPTAELRPQSEGQTDEDDLMPYPVLDWIERAAIRDKRGPVAVFELTRSKFPDQPVEEIHRWVGRFFQLWSRNQWKRERYAPSFHVDDENLDPKTWCRFPIISGGFQRELAELAECVQQLKRRQQDDRPKKDPT